LKQILTIAAVAIAILLTSGHGARRLASDTPPPWQNMMDEIADSPDTAS